MQTVRSDGPADVCIWFVAQNIQLEAEIRMETYQYRGFRIIIYLDPYDS